MSSANPLNAYKETNIKTASPVKLVIMLYDEALRQIDTAIELMEQGDKRLDRVNNAIIRAQDMVTELTVSLDFEKGGDIARNLNNIYFYFNQQLLDANIRKKPEILKPVRKLMAELRNAWQQISANANTSMDENASSYRGVNIAG
ncbi:flagellar export chaperone FliS [Marispirochaeta aestuarii]|uniref:flagellar export chaperone FliS n=1 Tax=Marispirochaeta aestuarii TaxID=1963862 RepID=UPI001E3B25F9|nr:flagellar export chaperone FliS [Marispirochaeta aestuarii]